MSREYEYQKSPTLIQIFDALYYEDTFGDWDTSILERANPEDVKAVIEKTQQYTGTVEEMRLLFERR